MAQKQGIFRAIWNKWLRFAEIVGTVQMVIILTIVYWLILTFMAIPFKLLSDPLATRGAGRSRWLKRTSVGNSLDAMKNQF